MKETTKSVMPNQELINKLTDEYNDVFGKYTKLCRFLMENKEYINELKEMQYDTSLKTKEEASAIPCIKQKIRHYEMMQEQLSCLVSYCQVLQRRIYLIEKGGAL